jgi:hypothetical protein
MKKISGLSLCIIGLLLMGADGRALTYENSECLECHGDPNLVQVLPSGELRSIFVDPAAWEGDVHNRKGLRCVDCHRGASPHSHPRGGLPEPDCSRCHPESAEDFLATTHAKMAGLTDNKLPECYDCHTAHAVRTKDDRQSTVHVKRIKETCRQCHPEIMPRGLVSRLATFRISGHRKENVSRSFDMKVCIRCHHEGAAHGRARIYHGMCNDCHRPRVEKATVGIHLIPSWKEQPVTFVLKYFDGLLALCVVLAVAGFFAMRYRGNIRSMVKGKNREE